MSYEAPRTMPTDSPREAARTDGDARMRVVPEGGEAGTQPTFPRTMPSRRETGNLPLHLTSFVGREAEIFAVRDALGASVRLLTLTGSGGCGKTRLAFAVAEKSLEDHPDGVWFVEFASISDAALVPWAVASAIGVREQPGSPIFETVAEHIGFEKLLLILDNCEHLVEACAEFALSLLRSCPNLRILATSREPLGVAGESVRIVPPLSVPESVRAPAVGLSRYEAIRLFCERATEALPTFALTDRNSGAVSEICRSLDGVPLAIELAAARVRMLSVAGISSRLDDSLGFLTNGSRTATDRHRTLRAALEWSHELLDEPEKGLFERLSVFSGGFTLEAVEAVSPDSDGTLDLLGGLVDKSLVVAEAGEDGVRRYSMLETIRQFGRERLEESGEIETVRRLHAEHCLEFAERAESEMRGQRQLLVSAGIEREYGNLRAALRWANEEPGQAEFGIRLSGALWRYWDTRGDMSEGRGWLEASLSRGGGSSRVRAKALDGAGWLGIYLGDYAGAVSQLEESLEISRRLGDSDTAATTLGHLMMAAGHAGDAAHCARIESEMKEILPNLGETLAKADLLLALALAAMSKSEFVHMNDLFTRSHALAEWVGFARGARMSLTCHGLGKLPEGDVDGAESLFRRALPMLGEGGDKLGIAYVLWGSGGVASRRSQPVRAARLWGAAEALRKVLGMSLSKFDLANSDYDGQLSMSRERIGEAAWSAAWNEGREMGFETAIKYVFECEEKEKPRARPAGLTGREVEVLRLVAEGMTNAEVARSLYITSRTVNGHLTSVYKKIGVSSRAAASRFAADSGLL